jgi:hypothetical protein
MLVACVRRIGVNHGDQDAHLMQISSATNSLSSIVRHNWILSAKIRRGIKD